MKPVNAAVLALLTQLLLSPEALAADGDTKIVVNFTVKTVRVRPTHFVGSGQSIINIVLKADGSVEDRHDHLGGPTWNSVRQLGADYRVVDAGTIVRTVDAGTHLNQLTVKLVGKKDCTAAVEYILKPGETEYRSYSTQLRQLAYYSSITMVSASCRISN